MPQLTLNALPYGSWHGATLAEGLATEVAPQVAVGHNANELLLTVEEVRPMEELLVAKELLPWALLVPALDPDDTIDVPTTEVRTADELLADGDVTNTPATSSAAPGAKAAPAFFR